MHGSPYSAAAPKTLLALADDYEDRLATAS